MLTDNTDKLKKLIHDAITQYSADQYLQDKKIDPLKQCEFVGIFIAIEAEKEIANELLGDIEKHLKEYQWRTDPDLSKRHYPYCPTDLKTLKQKYRVE